ncbi:MAG: polysaccharide deacetylase family protein [Chitinivibrionales bacterium]|nr:polysaccharide deacetylase family protein [Chitinivibrionales bacterium]
MTVRQITITLCFVSWYSIVWADNVPPSQKPPKNLASTNVPQFVIWGFDDQETPDGMKAVLSMFKNKTNPHGSGQSGNFDGKPIGCSFYSNSYNFPAGNVKQLHTEAYSAGFDMGNHTHDHMTTFTTSESGWKSNIESCTRELVALGIAQSKIIGFRSPRLEYTNFTFKVLQQLGFIYDCSIEEGFEPDMTAGSYYWPYTLDNGSPGNKIAVEWDIGYEVITSYAGLWEIPCYTFIAPPDEECSKYGISSGLRKRVKSAMNDGFNEKDGKITGLDYNVLYQANASPAEFCGMLKYTLDLNYNGNRAPMTIGAHSKYYSDGQVGKALGDFLAFALAKPDVRVISTIDLVAWLRNPTPLDPNKTGITDTPAGHNLAQPIRVAFVSGNLLSIQGLQPGVHTISLYDLHGKKVEERTLSATTSLTYSLSKKSITSSLLVVSIRSAGRTTTTVAGVLK